MTSSGEMSCPGQGSSWGLGDFVTHIERFQVYSIFSIGFKMDIERSQIYPSMKIQTWGHHELIFARQTEHHTPIYVQIFCWFARAPPSRILDFCWAFLPLQEKILRPLWWQTSTRHSVEHVKFLAPNRSDEIRMTQNVLHEIEEYCRVPQIYQGFGSINRPWHTWEVFIECDCTMLEINPLASLTDGRVLVCDSKVPRSYKWDRLLTRQPRRKTWGEVMEGCNSWEWVVE